MKVVIKNHQEWLEQRTKGIGASEIGTIMGVNPYETLYSLWQRKKATEVTEEQNEAMLWGHLLEDAVAQRFAIATNAEIIKNSAEEIMYIHDEKDFMRISPDRLYYNEGDKHNKENLRLLECKTALIPIDANDIPKSYFCQCQYQMHVSGIKHCTLAWMNLSNRTFGFKEYEYDEEFGAILEKNVEEFWNRFIIGDEEPEASTAEDTIKKYPKQIEGSILEVNNEEQKSRIERLLEVKKQIKDIETNGYEALKKEEKELNDEIKIIMGNNENLTIDGELLFTFKTAKDKRVFDEKKALEMHPDLVECYNIVNGNRTLLCKRKAS